MKVSRFAGACIIESGKILLVQEAHKEAYGLWSLPVGHVDDGEKESEAAQRETREETGYIVAIGQGKKFEMDGIGFKSTSDFNDHQIELTIFNASIESGNLLKGNDVLDAKWFPLGEVSQLPLRGQWIKSCLKISTGWTI